MTDIVDLVRYAREIIDGSRHPDIGTWWDQLPAQEQRDVLAFVVYETRRRRRRAPQRRAMRLLRSWMTPADRRQLAKRGNIRVRGSLGGIYRLHPETGAIQAVRRHGRRWFVQARYCIHHEMTVPGADLSLAHYLLLTTNEGRFLAIANRTEARPDCWNPDYMRRRAAIRRRRRDSTYSDGAINEAAA